MDNHVKGLLLTALGVLLVVPDSLFVRLIDAEPLVTAFWRGMTSGLLILIYVVLFQGSEGFKQVAKTGWTGVIYAILIGSTTIGFVLAVENTSVANVVFIFATIPVFSAIFSWFWLGERLSRRILITMFVVMLGLGVVAAGSGASEIASWRGDLWALYVSIAYAAALTAVRRAKDVSMIPAIPVAYIGSALVVAGFHAPFADFWQQWHLFLGHGLFIGIATCLLTLGPRYISSTEVSLLILLESVLAPILVWIVVGEEPGSITLVGGVIVIGALVISNLVVLMRRRTSTMTT